MDSRSESGDWPYQEPEPLLRNGSCIDPASLSGRIRVKAMRLGERWAAGWMGMDDCLQTMYIPAEGFILWRKRRVMSSNGGLRKTGLRSRPWYRFQDERSGRRAARFPGRAVAVKASCGFSFR